MLVKVIVKVENDGMVMNDEGGKDNDRKGKRDASNQVHATNIKQLLG